MNVTAGWFFLVGGVIGAIRIATAKKFYKSDFASLDGVITEGDRKTEVSMTPAKRWLLVALCLLLFIVGIVMIQRQHNWNPMQSELQSQGYMLGRVAQI